MIDVEAVKVQIQQIDEEIVEIDKQLEVYLKELGL